MTRASAVLAAAVGVAAGTYAALVARAWHRYGSPPAPRSAERDDLLDRFMPVYDIVERHDIHVTAPAEVTLAAAREFDLFRHPPIRAIFKAREWILGAKPDESERPRGLVAEAVSIGWHVLAEHPDREVVVGAVTRPWEANVVFRPVPPEAFASFAEPDYVKIVWALRADPVDQTTSIFRTETRATATDESARRKFRRYWAFVSPGIVSIRWLALHPVKDAAEHRYRRRTAGVSGTPPR